MVSLIKIKQYLVSLILFFIIRLTRDIFHYLLWSILSSPLKYAENQFLPGLLLRLFPGNRKKVASKDISIMSCTYVILQHHCIQPNSNDKTNLSPDSPTQPPSKKYKTKKNQ